MFREKERITELPTSETGGKQKTKSSESYEKKKIKKYFPFYGGAVNAFAGTLFDKHVYGIFSPDIPGIK